MIVLAMFLRAGLLTPASTDEDAPSPVIESIVIEVQDVFEDGGETPALWPYRLANQLHIDTRKSVVERELLFGVGDPLDPEALAQTERNLRALPFLREARVEVLPSDPSRPSEGVRVRVLVSDSWSTRPEARLAKVGNRWVWALGLSEGNLLGRGKQIQALHSSDLDRDESFVLYQDPRLFGSRLTVSTLLSKASDGHRGWVQALRPFYSLETLWGFRAGVEDFDRLDPLYQDGEKVEELRHVREWLEIDVARAIRRTASSAVRLHFGYELSRDDVEEDERRFGILRLGISSVSHSFRKLTHVNRFERIEDINLGNEASAFVGVSSSDLGGEPGRSFFFHLSERKGFGLNDQGFLLGSVSWRARYRREALENSIARVRVDLVQKLSLRRLVLAKADLHYGKDLDPELQFRLGAESGLRGYPVRQFNGNRSLLLGIEGRWFLADDVLRLVSIGMAGFFESGFAWPEGRPMAVRDLRSDVGVSLLLGANRVSASRPGVRFDLAYALDPVEGRSRWLFSAGSQVGF